MSKFKQAMKEINNVNQRLNREQEISQFYIAKINNLNAELNRAVGVIVSLVREFGENDTLRLSSKSLDTVKIGSVVTSEIDPESRDVILMIKDPPTVEPSTVEPSTEEVIQEPEDANI